MFLTLTLEEISLRIERTMWRTAIGCLTALVMTATAVVGFTGTAQAAVFNLFINDDTGRCITVAGGSQSNNANVIDSSCVGVGWQSFELRSVGGGYFLIVAAHSSKCLDVHEARTGNGADVQQYTCHALFNQQWQRVILGNGNSRFVARHSGKCLEVAGNSNDIQQWGCSSNRQQEWELG